MTLATANLSVKSIIQLLGVATAKDIFYNGSTLRTKTQLEAIVSKYGLSATYCPGADADARITNLLVDRKLSYFKGYTHASRSIGGYLYNGFTVSNANFAPAGWRVPTLADWTSMITYVGDTSIVGGKLKEEGTTNWQTPNTGATNITSFTALPSGYRTNVGDFIELHLNSVIWGDNKLNGRGLIEYIRMFYDSAAIEYYGKFSSYYDFSEKSGCPIRLIKTDTTNPGTITDYDGNIYDCIGIGTQVWTKQNWRCSHLNNGTLIPTVTDVGTWVAMTTMAKCAYANNESYV